MLIWFPFSIITLLLAYLADPKNKFSTQRLFYSFLLIVWLAWFVSFGGGKMTDYHMYEVMYNDYSSLSLFAIDKMVSMHIASFSSSTQNMEIGYVFLNVLFNKLGFTYVGFFFIYAIICNSLLVKFIFRYQYPVFAILILLATIFYTQQANAVRQMMAVSIFLYSTKYIVEKNIIKYLMLVFVATFIHVSAFILIPVYFISTKTINKYVMLSILVASLLVGMFKLSLPLVNEYILPFYNRTLVQRGALRDNTSENYIQNLILATFILLKGNTWDSQKKNLLALNLYFVGVVFANLSSISFVFDRLSYYFTICSIVIIPHLPWYIENSIIGRSVNNKLIFQLLWLFTIIFYSNIILRRVLTESITLGAKMYGFFDMFK